MHKKRHLSLKDCYAILQVTRPSSYEEVKRSYRKKAFALHPDLNPGKPEASSNFQLLNEAYVKLSHFLKTQQTSHAKASPHKDNEPEPSDETKQNAHTAYNKEKKRSEEDQKNQQENKSQDTKDANAESTNKEQDKASEQKHANKPEDEGNKEDVLRDLLSDPFAKRVFQDIYSEINRKNNAKSTFVDVEVDQVVLPPKVKKTKKINMEWGSKKVNIDLTHGVGGIIKNWLRGQIDENQNFKFPASQLRPGARIRFQIRRGLPPELATVEITLPANFVIGKPVRLKGLGKKIGPWQGDLYLLLEPLGT